MYVIFTCKYEKDLIKNSWGKMATPFYKSMGIFQGQLTPQSVVGSGQISTSHACHHYLQVWKGSDKKQPRKSGNTVFAIIILSVAMKTSCRIWPNFKLIQALVYVLVTCKYEMDLIKNSREKVATRFPIISLWGFFSDAQGQLTPQSVVGSGWISNSSKLPCMSSLSASIKRIGRKTPEKKFSPL